MNKWEKAEARARERHELERRGEQLAALVKLHMVIKELKPILATLDAVENTIMPFYQRAFCMQLEAAIMVYENRLSAEPIADPTVDDKPDRT